MISPDRICLIEDDEIMRTSLCQRFIIEGIECDCFIDALEAMESLTSNSYGALITDIRLPNVSGEELYQNLLKSGCTPPPTIFITGFGTVDQAVRLLKKGASDYITKPFDLDKLLLKLKKIAPTIFKDSNHSSSELGLSPQMRQIMETLDRLAEHKVDVLITGESGVGKEYAAQYFSKLLNDNKNKPFIAINCAALPEDLLEAELFGHEKGAFTGALKERRGLFEQANGGVLFLDEVGETSPRMQAKLLRSIQERSIQRVGSEKVIPVDICLVYATNKNLNQMVMEGIFREDLYYRINVAHVYIPPLRERKEDILWLANKITNDFYHKHNQRRLILPITEQYLKKQSWPGNLRELANTVERACILSKQEVLGPNEFDSTIDFDTTSPSIMNLKDTMEQYEISILHETLEHHQWKINETAQSLGISRKNLWEKMKRYGLSQNSEE